MPNHCLNELYIRGDNEELCSFMEAYGSTTAKNDPDRLIPFTWKDYDQIRRGNVVIDCDKVKPVPPELYLPSYSIENMTRRKFEELMHELSHMPAEWKKEYRDSFNQLRKNIRNYGYPTADEFCCEEWGTKWGAYHGCINLSDRCLHLGFDTAWSPMLPIVKKLIHDHPALEFEYEYEEPGLAFKGILVGKSGQILRDECWDWNEEDDEPDDNGGELVD